MIEPDVDPIALLLPAVQAARDVGDQSTHGNLKQLSIACHNYEGVPDEGQLTLAVEDWPA